MTPIDPGRAMLMDHDGPHGFLSAANRIQGGQCSAIRSSRPAVLAAPRFAPVTRKVFVDRLDGAPVGLLDTPRASAPWPTDRDDDSMGLLETGFDGRVLAATLFDDDPAGLGGDVTAALGGDAAA